MRTGGPLAWALAATSLVAVVGLVACSGPRRAGPETTTADTTAIDSPALDSAAPEAGTPSPSSVPQQQSHSAKSARLADDVCEGRAKITDVARIESDQITEASGIVASRTNPGIWWVTNDSGDSARIFAVDEQGRLRATLAITGAEAVDWEDLAIDGDTIFVADTGDGKARRKSVTVYSVNEPTLPSTTEGTAGEPVMRSAAARALTLTYPDGAHDAEALVFDPVSGDLVVLTKDWSLQGVSGIYRTPPPSDHNRNGQLERVGELTSGFGTLVTGADISPDGALIVVRSYAGVDLFRRAAGDDVATALESVPCGAPSPSERQGESIGFSADGSSYVTVSEGSRQQLHRTHG